MRSHDFVSVSEVLAGTLGLPCYHMKLLTALALVVLIGASGFLLSSLFRNRQQDTVGEICEIIYYVDPDHEPEVKHFSSTTSKEDRALIRRALARAYLKDKYQTPP